jgi:stearoyl-CoA desaturase (delta-9 desaturase)
LHIQSACNSLSPSRELPVTPVPLRARLLTLAAVILPPAGVATAIVFLWGWGFSWVALGLLLGMGLLTSFGVTVGYHRLFTHRSFETYAWVKFVMAAVGAMAVQGPVLRWVAYHRRHHQHSDTLADPHTPHHHGRGVLGAIRGFWYAHVGWVFGPEPTGLERYVRDLRRSTSLRVADALSPLWIALGVVIPAVLGGVISGSWWGGALGALWGGPVRVFLTHHLTWSVNSVCHLWGARPYPDRDESRNNVIFGVLALGEGWHNNHHAFPTSARHGLRWWQVDLSYYLIRLLGFTGLAWNIRLPTGRSNSIRSVSSNQAGGMR